MTWTSLAFSVCFISLFFGWAFSGVLDLAATLAYNFYYGFLAFDADLDRGFSVTFIFSTLTGVLDLGYSIGFYYLAGDLGNTLAYYF